MAKLKLWVRNLIISLVLILSVAGVGVGLYFVFQPKQPGTDPDKPKELTPEQRQFISAVSQNEQVDVDPQAYAGLVLSDGTETTSIGVNNIVGKFGDYFVTNVSGDIAIYKQDAGAASLTSTTTNQAITLNKVAINTTFDKIYQGEDDRDGYYISGDYAILEKADHSLVIVSLLTGNVVLEQSAFDASDVDELNPVGSWMRGIEYFGHNFLIVRDMRCTRYVSESDYDMDSKYVVYHLGDTEHAIEYNDAENQLLGYEITEDYAEFVSAQKTSVYSTELGDNGRVALALDEITNSCIKTTSTAVATIDGVGYSKLQYSTVQFIPGTTFAIVARNNATTEAKVVPDENGNAQEVYDGVFYDDMLLSRVLVGANYRVLNVSNNSYVSGVQLSGKVEAKKSSIDGYIELIENQHLGYFGSSSMQIYGLANQTARYFDANFNEMVSYDYSVGGDVIYFSGDTYYAVREEGGSVTFDVWGERTLDLSAWQMVSTSVINSIAVVKHVSDISSYELYSVATKENIEGRYKFASQIMNGKVIVYRAAETEEDVSGFYLIDLATMTRSAIVGFDAESFNLVAGSVGFYFTKGTDNKYTLHFTNGAEDITNITAYDFYGAENEDGIKVPQTIGGNIYIELTIESETQKRIISGKALGTFAELSSEEIEEKYPITITASNSTSLTRTRLVDKNIASTTSYDGEGNGNSNTITLASGYFKVKIDMSGDIPTYTLQYSNSGFSSSGSSDQFTYCGVSITSSKLSTPVATLSSAGKLSLKEGYILHKGSNGNGIYCDMPAQELTESSGWYSYNITENKNDIVAVVSAYKSSITRYWESVGVSGNVTGDHWIDSTKGVVKYNVDDSSGHYVIKAVTVNSNYTITKASAQEGDWSYGGTQGDHRVQGNFKSGMTIEDYHFFHHIWEDGYSWEYYKRLDKVSVTYDMPSYSKGNTIYVARSKTDMALNSNNDVGYESSGDANCSYMTSGETMLDFDNVYTDVNYGFVKNYKYRGSNYVGTVRTNFSGFCVASTGFSLLGLYQGETRKVKDNGDFENSGPSYNADLVPWQRADNYTVKYHYATVDYLRNDDLPLTSWSTSSIESFSNGNKYNVNESISAVYNKENADVWLWPNNDADNSVSGDNRKLYEPYGYDFAYWYIPSMNVRLYYNQRNNIKVFGRYTTSASSSTKYLFESPEKTGPRYSQRKTYDIDVYAIYTAKTYTLQVNLQSVLDAGYHLKVNNSGSSFDDATSNTKQYSNINFASSELTINTMFVTDEATYKDVVLESGKTNSSYSNGAKINLSFGTSDDRQINASQNDVSWHHFLESFSDLKSHVDDSSHNVLTLNAVVDNMQYALSYNHTIDDHVYIDGLSVGGIDIDYEQSELDVSEYTAHKFFRGSGTWTSGGNNGADKIVYTNFLPGYKIVIDYTYRNGSSTGISKQVWFEHRGEGNSGDAIASDTSALAGIQTNITFNLNSSNNLTVTFENYYGNYYVSGGRGCFGTSGDKTQSEIEVVATITSLPYDLKVETTSGSSTTEKQYTDNGQPNVEETGLLNNSYSEAINGRYDKKRAGEATHGYEQLAYGSTLLVNVGSSLYKFLHTRNYVPDSYIASINVMFAGNTTPLWSKSDFGTAMEEFAKAMGEAKTASVASGAYGQYEIARVDTATWQMYDTDGVVVIDGADQLNALLAVMYGRSSGTPNLSTADDILKHMVNSQPVNPLMYNIQKFTSGDFVVYVITTKFVDNESNDRNSLFGVSTALMFDIKETWGTINNTYTINLVTQPISYTIEHSVTAKDDAAGSGGVEVVWNWDENHPEDGASYAGNYDVTSGDNKPTFDGRMSATTSSGTTTYSDAAPSDYLQFDVNTKKGYYVDHVDITYNGVEYQIRFKQLEMPSDQDSIRFVYELYHKVGANWVEYVFTNPATNEILVGNPRLVVNTLFEIRNNAIPSSAQESTVLNLIFGYVHENMTINVTYGTYTLLRFEAKDENESGEFDESKRIGYTYDAGKLVVQKATGAIATVSFGALQLNTLENQQRVYALAKSQSNDAFTAYDGAGIEDRASTILYFFVRDYSVKGEESKIEVATTLNTSASYQMIVVSAENYKNNIATIAIENQDTAKTKKYVTSTYAGSLNKINVASFAIMPKHINTTIQSNIDFGGNMEHVSGTSNKVFEETLNAAVTGNLNNGLLYYINKDGTLTIGENKTNAGQIASTGTSIDYKIANYGQSASSDEQRLYYQYGNYYNVFGENLTFTICTDYGYEFTGFTLLVYFEEIEFTKYFSLSELKNAPAGEICSVSRSGETDKKVGTYEFVDINTADGHVYTFALTITNLASESFVAKMHYAAKTFDVNYNTNAAFGSSNVNEEPQTDATSRTFVYNVKSDVNYGTNYLKVNADKAADFVSEHPESSPTSNNGGVNYSRVGYDQVGWAFGTAAFGKITSETPINQRGGRDIGQTLNIDTYINGVTEDNYSTHQDFASIRALIETVPSIYLTALYKVGRKDVADAGFAWYYSLGKNFANVFGTDNSLPNGEAGATTTLYAIWNAKEYLIKLDYNDATNEKGSSTASKFYAEWVFDQEINILDEEYGNLSFASSSYANANILVNQLYNTYRLGYTFDGWYFAEGTFNSATGWNADCLIYQNDYTRKAANFVTGNNTSTAVLNADVYAKIVAQSSWKEMADEYDESQESYISRHTLDGARMDSNRSRIDIFAKWTANVYTFVYDLNAVTGNAYNINSLGWNGTEINNNIAMGVGSSTAALAESDSGIVQIEFDTDFALLKTYAYRYGYRFGGWYATRNNNGDFDCGLVEDEVFDVQFLAYFMNRTDNPEPEEYDVLSGLENFTEADIELELAYLKIKAQPSSTHLVEATNAVDSVDVVDGKASNGADQNGAALGTSHNKILLHARWDALAYTMNFDLNNEGHIDYAWDDADYAVAGTETGKSKHLINSTWLTYEVLFDRPFETGKLTLATVASGVLDYTSWNSTSSDYTYRNMGDDATLSIHSCYIDFTRYSSPQTISGTDYELLIQLLYSYGYNLGLNDGSNTYYFTLTRDTLGFEKKAIGSPAVTYAINGTTVFNESYLLNAKYEATETDYANEGSYDYLNTIDNSGSVGHHVGDMHKQNSSAVAFGSRNLTLFAYWTQKELSAGNNDKTYSSVEQYNNNMHNDSLQALVTEGEYVDGTREHVTKYDQRLATKTDTTITFFAPTGQYVSELYIDIYDDRLAFDNSGMGTYTNKNAYVGRLTLYFGWDSVTRTTTIGKQTANGHLIGKLELKHNFNGACSDIYVIRGSAIEGSGNIAYYYEYDQDLMYLARQLRIETSVYKTNEAGITYWNNLAEKNINNSYGLQDTYFEEGSNYDINVVTLTLESLKTNLVVSAKNLAQTYQVDYYRYIRPTDSYTTKINSDSDSSIAIGEEYWDSEFYNNWNQYLVYQKLTYRYGEYASMSYSYASNFAFENWYYYQAHVNNPVDYNEYACYDLDGSIAWQTNQSSGIAEDNLIDEFGYWTAITYVWDDNTSSYVNTADSSDTLNYGDQKLGDKQSLTIHQYHRYTQTKEEGRKIYDNDNLVVKSSEYGFFNNNTYKYDRNPIRGNISLICLYVPASVHRVHYYSWAAAGGYEDRTASTREYIMGEKKEVQVTVLGSSVAVVDTWILGTNAEYYYVGFSGINQFVREIHEYVPSRASAYAFLAQFLNCTTTPANYEVVNSNRIKISWSDLLAALNSGVNLNGKEYKVSGVVDPQQYAVKLLRLLVQEYSAPADDRAYGFNGTYLADIEVIKNMTFYVGDFKEAVESIEVPTIMWYEAGGYYYISNDNIDEETLLPTDATTKYYPGDGATEEIQKQNAYNAAYNVVQEDYKKRVFSAVYIYVCEEHVSIDGKLPIDAQKTYDIVSGLDARDLNILLNSISIDYFGFILKNPSNVVNVYPSGDNTYFAGWYLVDGTFYDYLMSNRDVVLTFNSDTWNLDSTSYRTLYVGDEIYHEEDGTRTYVLSENADGTGRQFEVSRFHTIDQLTHAIDKLSRVENEIFVFAAFNCYRFEFKEEGTNFVMTSSELQWGSRKPDSNGDPYQYRIQDVDYFVLDTDQFNAFIEAVKENDNLPTSLQNVINLARTVNRLNKTAIKEDGKTVGYYFSLNDNIPSLLTQGCYIVACVYNVSEVEFDINDPEHKRATREKDSQGNDIINMVSSNVIVVANKGGNAEIKTISELLDE